MPISGNTVNGNVEVVPPPGVGFFTETLSVPACAKSRTGRVAWSCVELNSVVGRATPFIRTLEDTLKLDPVTSSVTAGPPVAALNGERRLSCGTGLFTVNVTTTDGRVPGFVTVTVGVPATAITVAGILACNSETLENVEGTGFPLKLTIELEVKPLPDKVNVNDGPPAVALAGDSAPITG